MVLGRPGAQLPPQHTTGAVEMGELGLEMLETAPETHMGIREACTKRNRRSTWEPTLTWIRVVTGCSWYLRGKAPKAPMNTWLEMQVASRKPPGRRN